MGLRLKVDEINRKRKKNTIYYKFTQSHRKSKEISLKWSRKEYKKTLDLVDNSTWLSSFYI